MNVNDSYNRLVRTSILDTAAVQVSVTDFGVDRTGVLDSFRAIQNAIESLTIVGGTVFLPSGTYLISQSIVLPQGVSLIGEGSGITSLTQPTSDFPNVTKIKAIPGGAFPVITIAGSPISSISAISIEKIVIVGGGTSIVGARGIDQQWANYTTVRDVRIHGCHQALYTNNVYLINFFNVNVDGAGADQSSYGLYMGTHDMLLGNNAINMTNCLFQNNLINGIRGETFSGGVYTSCQITLSGQTGWYFGDPSTPGALCQFCNIVNCLVDSCAGEGYVFSKGVAARLGAVAVTGCWSGNNATGIRVSGGDQFSIVGGLIQNVSTGIILDGCNACNITGINIFEYDRTLVGAFACIFVNSTSRCSAENYVARRIPGGLGGPFISDASSSLLNNKVSVNSIVPISYLGTATDTTLYNGNLVISGGDPLGVITPVSIGELCLRIDTGKMWTCNGLTSASWFVLN